MPLTVNIYTLTLHPLGYRFKQLLFHSHLAEMIQTNKCTSTQLPDVTMLR